SEEVSLLVEPLASKLVWIVEHERCVYAATDRQRLPCIDVDQEIGSGLRRHGIGSSTNPAVFVAAIGSRRVPISHRGEVRKRRIRIAASVHDAQFAFFVESLEPDHT